MVMSTQIAVVPREFRAVHDQLARWRRTRRPGMPIPAPLWAAIAAVARRHGATRTAHALGLDSHKVKTVMDAGGCPLPAPAQPAFVEVVAPPVSGSACVLEVDGPRGGRLRVQVTGHALPDLVALSRVVWSAE
jgi:hypothetical protein